jgi:Tfp pilus assembly protein PilF
VLFARALLRQYRHDFAGALRDLGRALESDPALDEARAWRAAIFMVQADYAAAARECGALPAGLLAAGCSAYVEATTGDTRGAYRRLADALAREPAAGPRARLWVLTRLAEMATRLEDDKAAERHFRDALALGVTDNFLLAAYADYLLQRGRAAEVLPLLKDWERSDTLLLRLALAARALQRPEAERHARSLGERFAAAALRGEQLHLAEEARYHLDLQRDPKRALAAATGNWRSQREPRDALVLLEAALAAGDRAAAAPALRWLEQTRYEDPRLQRIAERLR